MALAEVWKLEGPRDCQLLVAGQGWLLYSGSELYNRLMTTDNALCLHSAFLLRN